MATKFKFDILLEHKVTEPGAYGTIGRYRFVIAETDCFPAKWYVGQINQWGEPTSNATYHYFKTQEGDLKQFYQYVKLFPQPKE